MPCLKDFALLKASTTAVEGAADGKGAVGHAANEAEIPFWLKDLPDPARTVSGLVEDFFVRKLTAKPASLPALPLPLQHAAPGNHGALLPHPGDFSLEKHSWLQELPDASRTVGRLVEDFFVVKLIDRGLKGRNGGRSLVPPEWARAPPPETWDVASDSPSEPLPEAESEHCTEGEGMEGGFSVIPPTSQRPSDTIAELGAELGLVTGSLAEGCASAADSLEALADVAGVLRRVKGAVEVVVLHSWEDEGAAQLWLMALKRALQRPQKLLHQVDQIRASKALLLVQSTETLPEVEDAVREVGRVIALMPRALRDSLSDRNSEEMLDLQRDMECCRLALSRCEAEAQQKLVLLLAEVASSKKFHGKGSNAKESDSQAKDARSLGLKSSILGLGLETPQNVYQRMYGTQHRQAAVEVFQMLGGAADGTEKHKDVIFEVQQLRALQKGKKLCSAVTLEDESNNEQLELCSATEDGVATGLLVFLEACQLAASTPVTPPATVDFEEKAASKLEETMRTEVSPQGSLQSGGRVGGNSIEDGSGEVLQDLPERALEQATVPQYTCRMYKVAELESSLGCQVAQTRGEINASLHNKAVTLQILDPSAAPESLFHTEVEALARLRHPHVQSLLGCCPEASCLVYEQAPPLSLEDFLGKAAGGRKPLAWFVRFRIAAEVASALEYLHSLEPHPVLHRDLRPQNIGLVMGKVISAAAQEEEDYSGQPSTPGATQAIAPASTNRNSRSLSLSFRSKTSAQASLSGLEKKPWLSFLPKWKQKSIASGVSSSTTVDIPAAAPAKEGKDAGKGAAVEKRRRITSMLTRAGVAALAPARKLGKTPVQDVVYLDPEFPRTDELVPASDVYSFGVVLCQLLTGKGASAALGAVTSLVEGRLSLEEVLDKAAGDWPVEVAKSVAELASTCTDMRRELRPGLRDTVVPTLDRAKDMAARAEESSQ